MTSPATAVRLRRRTAGFLFSAEVSHASCRRCADASYNKPFSVKAWLEQVDVEEEFVLMMDTDMYLRAPVDPVALGVRRGNVVSAEYSYLYGTESGFAKRFLEHRLLGRLAQVLYSE